MIPSCSCCCAASITLRSAFVTTHSDPDLSDHGGVVLVLPLVRVDRFEYGQLAGCVIRSLPQVLLRLTTRDDSTTAQSQGELAPVVSNVSDSAPFVEVDPLDFVPLDLRRRRRLGIRLVECAENLSSKLELDVRGRIGYSESAVLLPLQRLCSGRRACALRAQVSRLSQK